VQILFWPTLNIRRTNIVLASPTYTAYIYSSGQPYILHTAALQVPDSSAYPLPDLQDFLVVCRMSYVSNTASPQVQTAAGHRPLSLKTLLSSRQNLWAATPPFPYWMPEVSPPLACYSCFERSMLAPVHSATTFFAGFLSNTRRVSQNHIFTVYTRYFGREITKYMVIYGVQILFWPTLNIRHIYTVLANPKYTAYIYGPGQP